MNMHPFFSILFSAIHIIFCCYFSK
uniref:Uncharacterized protein n=1 Tax=Lepeophtheirus salmonis TaxID=72036 RepID=A0A0K2UKE3_LEPSM